MVTKDEMRLRAKALRKSLVVNSEKIIDKIHNFDVYQSAKNIMIYYPLKNEIDLLELIKDNGKNFYLPRVVGENLEVCPYIFEDKLLKSKFNVLEPVCEAINPSVLDLVFVPALMVDEQKYRLGYGKGYYDRFILKLSQKCKTVTVISQKLTAKSLPTDEFDIPVDFVITD